MSGRGAPDDLSSEDVLRHIEGDHAQLEQALDDLDGLLARLASGEDQDELEGVCQIIRHEVDAHFPEEERLLAGLGPDFAELRHRVCQQHETLRAEAARFERLVTAALGDVIVDRDQIVQTAGSLLTQMRDHMRMEQTYMLPAITRRVRGDG